MPLELLAFVFDWTLKVLIVLFLLVVLLGTRDRAA